MKVRDLRSIAALRQNLTGDGLALRIGPYVVGIRSSAEVVGRGIWQCYADYPLDATGFRDFHVGINPGRGLRRWLSPQARFEFDGQSPFQPLPSDQGFAALEWGLNWVFGNHSHQYMVIHAGVVARDNRALVMPGEPGSGKSTLCAALVQSGWRLLSDELALLDPATMTLTPIPRPIGLKNASIDVVRRRHPEAMLGPISRDTAKGVVAHLRPPEPSIRQAGDAARPAWLCFPRFSEGEACTAVPISPGETFMRLAANAFNYTAHGERGFQALADLVDLCPAYQMTFGSLEAALDTLAHAASDQPDARTGLA